MRWIEVRGIDNVILRGIVEALSGEFKRRVGGMGFVHYSWVMITIGIVAIILGSLFTSPILRNSTL